MDPTRCIFSAEEEALRAAGGSKGVTVAGDWDIDVLLEFEYFGALLLFCL